jgi:hypothetical protein
MKKLQNLLAALSIASTPLSALAFEQAPFQLGTNTLTASGGTGILPLMQVIANWIFTILLILAVIYILLAAFKYLTSEGNSEKITSAHRMLIYALVAVAVAFLAKGLIFVVQSLVGAHSISPSQL